MLDIIYIYIYYIQGQLIGSILSNLQLVLGLCFLCGGIKNRPEQKFNVVGANTLSSLLLLSSIGLCLPAVFQEILPSNMQEMVYIYNIYYALTLCLFRLCWLPLIALFVTLSPDLPSVLYLGIPS